MKKTIKIFLLLLLFVSMIPLFGTALDVVDVYLTNKRDHLLQEVDDSTRYETLKRVEDTSRAMISSYEADKATYEQYKDSTNKEQKSWSDQAKMRANRTVSSYNNYLLKNNYIWENNIPTDIKLELEIIE